MNKNDTRIELISELSESFSGPCVLEIGVWKGEFSEVLLDHLSPSLLVLVDPWVVSEEYTQAWYGPRTSKLEMEDNYLKVVSKFKNNHNVKVLKTFSKNLPSIYPSESFDFIYIDGDHTLKGFCDDLELSISLCKPGGYIACDDYNLPGWWDDAITKVIDSFKDNRLIHMGARGTQYVFQKAIFHYS